MLSFLPITTRLKAKIFGRAALASRASEIVELSPGVNRDAPSAIFLPGELERIQKSNLGDTLECQLSRLKAGKKSHGATTGYKLNGAIIGGGCLYFSGGYTAIRPTHTRTVMSGQFEHITEAQLCTNWVIERYFGHWLRDATMLEELASLRGCLALSLVRPTWLHEAGYRSLLKLPAHRVDLALVDELWVIDDRGLNEMWISRFESLRQRMRVMADAVGPSLVMLSRGALGSGRLLTNSAEMEAALQARGFVIVHPEAESVTTLVNSLAHAEIVVTVEGSAHNHAFMAMPRGSILITIQPPDHFNAMGKMVCDAIGLRWAFAVAEQNEHGFHMPPDRLTPIIDHAAQLL